MQNPWFITIIGGLIFFILGLIVYKGCIVYKGYIRTKGDYSPGIVEGNYQAGDTVSGDKIINYGTIIKNEIAKTDQNNIVTEEFIKDFFIRLQLSLSEKRVSLPQNELDSLPSYLQRSYDMNVTISTSHGVGYEFITPSDNPKVNIIKTNLPIEEYYFSKYTDRKDFSKATAFRIRRKYWVFANFIFIAGKIIVVEQDGNVLLKNVGLKYAKEDSTKEFEFLRLFANNQNNYWNQMNPKDEATFLFSAHQKIAGPPQADLRPPLRPDSSGLRSK